MQDGLNRTDILVQKKLFLYEPDLDIKTKRRTLFENNIVMRKFATVFYVKLRIGVTSKKFYLNNVT